MHKLSRKGYTVIKDKLSEDLFNEIKEELTVKPFILNDYNVGQIKKFKLFEENKNKIYIPRFYGIKKLGIPSQINFLDSESIDIKFKGELRKEQKPIYDIVYQKLIKNGGAILSLKCGGGKTVFALYIASVLKMKTIVIVHKDFLMTQWKDRIEEFIPNAKIGKIQQNTIDIEGKDIVLSMVQSLSMKEYPKNIFYQFGLAIFDECHHLGAEVFCKCMPKVAAPIMFGLSATPKRKDGLTKVFEWYIGDIAYKSKEKLNDTVQVNIIKYKNTDVNYNKELLTYQRKPCCPKMINNICNFNPRNDILLKYLIECFHEGRNILVLSDRRNHLDIIHNKLKEKSIDSGYYVGGMKPSELKVSETKSIILGTYSMASEGMDIPKLNTILLSSPKSDIVQSVGRILREKPEVRKFIPLIIDINDDFSMFTNQSIKRIKYYEKQNYDITIINMNGEKKPYIQTKKIKLDRCLI